MLLPIYTAGNFPLFFLASHLNQMTSIGKNVQFPLSGNFIYK